MRPSCCTLGRPPVMPGDDGGRVSGNQAAPVGSFFPIPRRRRERYSLFFLPRTSSAGRRRAAATAPASRQLAERGGARRGRRSSARSSARARRDRRQRHPGGAQAEISRKSLQNNDEEFGMADSEIPRAAIRRLNRTPRWMRRLCDRSRHSCERQADGQPVARSEGPDGRTEEQGETQGRRGSNPKKSRPRHSASDIVNCPIYSTRVLAPFRSAGAWKGPEGILPIA